MLAGSMTSLLETAGDLVGELVVVVGPEADLAAIQAGVPSGPGLQIITDPAPFNYSRRINLGVANTQAPWLLWWNDDVVALGGGWLEAMLAAGEAPGVGAVGAVLRYADGTVQHAGVGFANGLPRHLGEAAIPTGPAGEVSAVTGACLLTRRDYFDTVGGLCLDLPLNYNDVDYCLKLRRTGLRCVVARDAQLRHDESQTRDAVLEDYEVQLLVARWWFELNDDSYRPDLAPLPSSIPRTDPR